jgi:hypothetical protein
MCDEPRKNITGREASDIAPTISCSEKLAPLTFRVTKYVDVFPNPIPRRIKSK